MWVFRKVIQLQSTRLNLQHYSKTEVIFYVYFYGVRNSGITLHEESSCILKRENVDHFKKLPPKDFFEMEKQIGRMMRNMSFLRVPPLENERWLPAADVYESDHEIIVCVDVSGVDPQNISVIAEQNSLTVSGNRSVVLQENIKNIHQLEIERGSFKRTISMPVDIDVTETLSVCKNGYLFVKLPKQKKKGRFKVKIT